MLPTEQFSTLTTPSSSEPAFHSGTQLNAALCLGSGGRDSFLCLVGVIKVSKRTAECHSEIGKR